MKQKLTRWRALSSLGVGFGLLASYLLASSLAAPAGLATHQSTIPNDPGPGYDVKASYYVGVWECSDNCGGENFNAEPGNEDTVLYLVNVSFEENNNVELGIDALVLVYDDNEAAIGCQIENLSLNDVAQVRISRVDRAGGPGVVENTNETFGVIKILLFKGGEAQRGDAATNRTNPKEYSVAAWSSQIDTSTANGNTLSFTELFPVPLGRRELDVIRNDFQFSTCPYDPDEPSEIP